MTSGNDGGYNSMETEELIVNSITKRSVDAALRIRSSIPCCILRVPEKFHKMNGNSVYIPEVVSIGPYHRGSERLKAGEILKLGFMHDLLLRNAMTKFGEEEEEAEIAGGRINQEMKIGGNEEEVIVEEDEQVVTPTRTVQLRAPRGWLLILKQCVAAVKRLETKIRNCYSDHIELESKDFVEMIAVDALFIIEFLTRLELHGVMVCNELFMDILLMENQIPLFVLEHLFIVTAGGDQLAETDAFYKLVIHYLQFSSPGKIYSFVSREYEWYWKDAKHILDLFSRLLHLGPFNQDDTDGISRYGDALASISGAVQLSRAGVRFKKYCGIYNNFLDIKFNSNGVFEIPTLTIDGSTERLFKNLIISEEFGRKWSASTCVISYACLMGCLINSAEDVQLLRRKGILISHLGSDEQVSHMFRKLCDSTNTSGFRYFEILDEVNKHYNKHKSTLKRDHFNNPWWIIFFSAAILLILLTIISTVLTTLAWVVRKL